MEAIEMEEAPKLVIIDLRTYTDAFREWTFYL